MMLNLSMGTWTLLSSLLFLDGIFHLFGFPRFIERYGPDWIIARGLFDRLGFPVIIHRIMGTLLILSGLYAIYLLRNGITSAFLIFYQNYVIPIALAVIMLAILIKIFGGK